MKRTIAMLWLVAGALIASALIAGPLRGAEDRASAPVDFARQILPVLSDKCFVCHGPDGESREVLRLDSFAAATREREGRRAIDPQKPENSELLARIHSADAPMPPADAERQLTAEERELLSRWVRQGGKFALHWSFVPPKKTLPADVNADADADAHASAVIDALVESGLRSRGWDFAAAADRETLARRAALVLTGLPPEPRQLSAFLSDDRADAYERLVDALLDSPRFGEHQARYWLDAVRYGDTHGLHLDNRRGIYPYRDWVVDALGRNLPLNDFITWQIAGDLLPDATLEQRVATGYVRMNPTTAEGGAIPAEFQAKNNFDRVETFGTVFLGMSLTCARCHTHKYDPIPQTEYYQLLAFFNSTSENSMDGNKYEYGPVARAPASVAAWSEWRELEAARDALLAAAVKLTENRGAEAPGALAPEAALKWRQADAPTRLEIAADPQGPFAAADASDAAADIHSQAVALRKRIDAAEKAFTTTLVAQDLAQPRPTFVLTRGEYDLPSGDSLEPSVFAVMSPFPASAPRNRLGLAQWLTDRRNPLTARVLVNRIWQRTFGAGLVRTPEDFGLQGQQPTHPELLDWLAVELHDSGWDLKRMLRSMVTSRTFRQSSARRGAIDDPENRWLARGPSHRLDAEVIRDIALWASGMLDPHMGGEGVKPYQPAGLWSALMHPASNTKLYVADKGARLYRRSLYVYWKRTSPHPMMTLFDAPSRESSCVRRSRTNTSLQSLGLLNETQRIELSRMFAERLLREGGDDDTQRLDLLFTLAVSRKPAEGERAACLKLLEAMRRRFAAAEKDAAALLSIGDAPRDATLNSAEHAAWSQLANTVLASDAAITLY